MIKKSLYEKELALLKKRYGADNIITLRNSLSLIIKNFRVPEFFKIKETILYIEVTEGYGFGVSPMNCFILLPSTCARFHLFPVSFDFLETELLNDFNKFSGKIKKISNKESFFWICFHFKENYKITNENEKFDIIGIVEYVSAVYFVLQKIAQGDNAIFGALEDMAANYQKADEERKKLLKMFKLELNWKKIKWMY